MLTFQGLLPDGDHVISYRIPNLLADHAMRNPPVPPGFWRGVNINPMPITEMPKVEVILMPSGGFWGGVGEPTIAVAAPAVLNAIFAATGRRIRQFPLRNFDLRAA